MAELTAQLSTEQKLEIRNEQTALMRQEATINEFAQTVSAQHTKMMAQLNQRSSELIAKLQSYAKALGHDIEATKFEWETLEFVPNPVAPTTPAAEQPESFEQLRDRLQSDESTAPAPGQPADLATAVAEVTKEQHPWQSVVDSYNKIASDELAPGDIE
jgi:hypothetical protein